MESTKGQVKFRNLIFISLILIGAGLIYRPLNDLLDTASRREYYSHILLIPFISAGLIYWDRDKFFKEVKYFLQGGIPVSLSGILLYLWGIEQKEILNQNDYTAILIFSIIVFWIGAFIVSYGYRAMRLALFPLLFLLFMVPIPMPIMEKVIYFLQLGSAEVTYFLFQIIDIPVARNGFTFELPKVSIEVAKECSGIRSSLALFITGILIAHYFLKTGWKKIILIFCIIPITIFKNGLRIVTLSLLAIYVDEKFLTGSFLHRSGGFVFYIPALILLGLVLLALRKTEKI